METHFDWSDEAFIRDFSTKEFPPALFNHEAHLRLAFIFLEKDGLEKALSAIPALLKAYVKAQGVTDKYHETLTRASVYIVDHFRSKSPQSDFRSLLEKFPSLKIEFKKLLSEHYSAEKLATPAAKSVFQAPDLLPFKYISQEYESRKKVKK